MCPQKDSNLRTWLRRPVLYPLSYGGVLALQEVTSSSRCLGPVRLDEIWPVSPLAVMLWAKPGYLL